MNKSLYDASMWETKPKKVSILVPTRDLVHTSFSFCITQLVKTSIENGLDIYVFYDSSTILLNQRNKLIQQALDIGSDYVLWLDSDMMFPSTTLLRLLNHNQNIVGCNYLKRTNPQTTVAYKKLNDWDSWIPMRPQDNLIEVEGVGMGCILMNTLIFQKLKKPYFKFTYDKKENLWHGEDFQLLERLRKHNVKTFIDTVLSMEIKHLGVSAF